MFDFSKVKAQDGLDFIGYGINHETEVVKIESIAEEGKTPYISIYFKIPGQDDGKATRVNEYMSDKSAPYTMEKLIKINNCLCKKEALSTKQFAGVVDLASTLTELWANRKMRLKLSAEEYMGVDKEGNPKLKTRVLLPRFNFCEATMPGAEHAPVAKEDSKLEFNKNDKYDYKRIAKEAPAPKENASDLPF